MNLMQEDKNTGPKKGLRVPHFLLEKESDCCVSPSEQMFWLYRGKNKLFLLRRRLLDQHALIFIVLA